MNLALDRKQLDDLAKACTILFVMVEEESYFLAQTHKDNPEIGASEMVVLTITRKHLPPQEPKPVPLVAEMELMPA